MVDVCSSSPLSPWGACKELRAVSPIGWLCNGCPSACARCCVYAALPPASVESIVTAARGVSRNASDLPWGFSYITIADLSAMVMYETPQGAVRELNNKVMYGCMLPEQFDDCNVWPGERYTMFASMAEFVDFFPPSFSEFCAPNPHHRLLGSDSCDYESTVDDLLTYSDQVMLMGRYTHFAFVTLNFKLLSNFPIREFLIAVKYVASLFYSFHLECVITFTEECPIASGGLWVYVIFDFQGLAVQPCVIRNICLAAINHSNGLMEYGKLTTKTHRHGGTRGTIVINIYLPTEVMQAVYLRTTKMQKQVLKGIISIPTHIRTMLSAEVFQVPSKKFKIENPSMFCAESMSDDSEVLPTERVIVCDSQALM